MLLSEYNPVLILKIFGQSRQCSLVFFGSTVVLCMVRQGEKGRKCVRLCTTPGYYRQKGVSRVQRMRHYYCACHPQQRASMSFGVDRSSAFPKEKQKLGNKGNLYTQSRTPF